jgi:hypothetical protein
MANEGEDQAPKPDRVWLVSVRVASYEWESFPRREPKPARERLGPLASRARAPQRKLPGSRRNEVNPVRLLAGVANGVLEMVRTKLTSDDISNILKMLNEGHPLWFIADHFNVSPNTIRGIRRGETWKHVEGPRPGPRKSSRFYGVSKHRGRWQAYGLLGSKKFHLGVFNTEEEAARAVNNFIIDQWLPRPLNAIQATSTIA